MMGFIIEVHLAPVYLSELCVMAVQKQSRYHLRSLSTNQLTVPTMKCLIYGAHSFSVSRPSIWNTLPDYLRDAILFVDTFKYYLKHFLSVLY